MKRQSNDGKKKNRKKQIKKPNQLTTPQAGLDYDRSDSAQVHCKLETLLKLVRGFRSARQKKRDANDGQHLLYYISTLANLDGAE
jgi:hypothetical protein